MPGPAGIGMCGFPQDGLHGVLPRMYMARGYYSTIQGDPPTETVREMHWPGRPGLGIVWAQSTHRRGGSMSNETIPVIDVAPFLTGSKTDKRGVARKLAAACEESGFFCITGHGIDEGLIARTRQAGADFFALPMDRKREILRDAEVIRKTNNIPSYLNCLMKASNFDVPTNYANSVGIKGSAFSRRIKAISRFRPTQLIDRLSAVGSIAAIIVLTAFLSSNFSITNLEAADAGGNPNQAPENMITSEELRNEARKLESTIETFYNEHRDRFYQEEQVFCE